MLIEKSAGDKRKGTDVVSHAGVDLKSKPAKTMRRLRRGKKQSEAAKRAKSVAEDDDGGTFEQTDESGEESLVDESSGSDSEDDDKVECELDENGQCKKVRHIHPCICDLTQKQRDRINAYLNKKRRMQLKFEKRVREIEEELARIEEERLEREREALEQEELFGDEYEIIGKKRKRKKRSARRASMVSLGVKQLINWRKDPRIAVKTTLASDLRKKYTTYCGIHEYPLSPPRPVDFHREPLIKIRSTETSEKRSKVNIEKKQQLMESEDKRPRFETKV